MEMVGVGVARAADRSDDLAGLDGHADRDARVDAGQVCIEVVRAVGRRELHAVAGQRVLAVASWTVPVTLSPWARWRSISAAAVPAPKWPSTPPRTAMPALTS